jgi:23S rRNA pseudouridine2604 synthase
MVNKILRVGNGHEKEYVVVVDKPITTDFINQMRNGIFILGTKTNKCFVKQEGDKKFRIILTQGLNRQIRRMCETLQYKVTALTRVRIMNFTLSNIAPGKWRYFTSEEISSLNELLKHSKKSVGDEGMGE